MNKLLFLITFMVTFGAQASEGDTWEKYNFNTTCGAGLYLENIILNKETSREDYEFVLRKNLCNQHVDADGKYMKLRNSYVTEKNTFKKDEILNEFIQNVGAPYDQHLRNVVSSKQPIYSEINAMRACVLGHYNQSQGGFPLKCDLRNAFVPPGGYFSGASISKRPVTANSVVQHVINFDDPRKVEDALSSGGRVVYEFYFKNFAITKQSFNNIKQEVIDLKPYVLKVSVFHKKKGVGSVATLGISDDEITQDVVKHCPRCNEFGRQ